MDGALETESSMMSIQEKIALLTEVYDRMPGLAAKADKQAGFVLSIHGIAAIAYGPHLAKLIVTFPLSPVKTILWLISFVLVCAFVIAFIRSAYQFILVLKPRIEPHLEHIPSKPSLIFFTDITKISGTDLHEKAGRYRKQLDETNYDDLIDDLVYRINDIANVVSAKNSCATEAVRRSLLTFSLLVISIVALAFMNTL